MKNFITIHLQFNIGHFCIFFTFDSHQQVFKRKQTGQVKKERNVEFRTKRGQIFFLQNK